MPERNNRTTDGTNQHDSDKQTVDVKNSLNQYLDYANESKDEKQAGSLFIELGCSRSLLPPTHYAEYIR